MTMLSKRTFLFAALLSGTTLCAQKNELRINFQTGSSFYRGKGAYSDVHYKLSPGSPGYVANDFGRLPGLVTGLNVSLARVGARRFIGGVALGYELLRTRSHIDSVLLPASGNQPQLRAAESGSRSELSAGYVTVHSFFGGRLLHRRVTLDLVAGPEFAFSAGRNWQRATVAYVDANGNRQQLDNAGYSETPALDLRAHSEIILGVGGLSVSVGYVQGLSNHADHGSGPVSVPAAHIRSLRLTLGWKVF